MNEETRRARYVLIDLSIFEEVIDLIGKCPAENCRGKVKIQTIFQKKKKKKKFGTVLQQPWGMWLKKQLFHQQKNSKL